MSNATESTKWRAWAVNVLLVVLSGMAAVGSFSPGRTTATPPPSVDIQPLAARVEKLEGTVNTHLQDRQSHLSASDVAVQVSPVRNELEALKTGLAAQQKQLDRIERAIADLLDRELRKAQ